MVPGSGPEGLSLTLPEASPGCGYRCGRGAGAVVPFFALALPPSIGSCIAVQGHSVADVADQYGGHPPPPPLTQRVRMSSGERPIGAAKGKQPNTEALCQPPPPPGHSWLFTTAPASPRVEPPPPQGAQPMPSHCPLTPSASFHGIHNRQQPPPTASATSSNRLSNRFWGRL